MIDNEQISQWPDTRINNNYIVIWVEILYIIIEELFVCVSVTNERIYKI